MIPVTREMEQKLKECFPYVLDENLFGEKRLCDLFKVFAISNFDHWLSEDEAFHFSVSYAAHVGIGEIPSAYFETETRYLNLFSDIVALVRNVYNFSEHEDGGGSFYQFDSVEEFLEVCRNSLREKSFIRLCIPDWKIIISGGHDLINIVHYTTDSVVHPLLKLIESNNLFAI